MLSDLKVIELASVLAGPAVGMFLAELGAHVTKIEHPERGDITRQWKLPSEDSNSPVSAYFSAINWGKEYLRLDLRSAAGQQKVKAMLKDADIVILNFKSGDAARFGLDYETLQKENPRLIWADLSGFTSTPKRIAYDVVLQAESGYMSMNGTPESGPVKLPLAFIDILAAHHLKQGILLALYNRERTGKGAHVVASLEKAAIANLCNQASNWLNAKHIPERLGSLHPNIAPYGEHFETADQRRIVLAVGSDKQFALLCEALGKPGLAKNPLFLHNHDRVSNRVALDEALSSGFILFEAKVLMARLHAAHVPAGLILNMDEVFENPTAQSMVLEEVIDGVATKRVSTVGFEILGN